MKKRSFLSKLKSGGKLELIEPSALFFKTGIKCENHAGSILLLKKLFDKQYYVSSKQNIALSEESSKDMLAKSEEFLVQMKLVIINLSNSEIEIAREKFNAITGDELR